MSTTPLGLDPLGASVRRVAPSAQPWAAGRCPVGAQANAQFDSEGLRLATSSERMRLGIRGLSELSLAIPSADCLRDDLHRRRPEVLSPRAPADRVSRFESRFAPLLSRWVQTDRELLWLAPGTPAPLTADKIAAWGSDRPTRYLYWRPES